jgi:hypothetical protein
VDSAVGVGADWAPVDIFHNSTDGGDPWIVLCKIDWAKYNEDPLGAGTFNKIVIKAGCTGELSAARRRWIRASELEAAIASCPAAGSGKPGAPILPSGFVFHESRCGSTLAANMLGGMPGAMVLAEPPPLWAVLRRCQDLGAAAQGRIVRAMIAQWGRYRGARRMFFKFDLLAFDGVAGDGDVGPVLSMLKHFPTVPWVFLFRESVAVMASHVGGKMSRGYRVRGKLNGRSICQRGRSGLGKKMRGKPILAVLRRAGVDTARAAGSGKPGAPILPKQVSLPLYCAGHLALISRFAMRAADAAKARPAEFPARFAFVDYKHLKRALLDFVLPVLFATPLSPPTRAKLLRISNYHSKDSGRKSSQKAGAAAPQLKVPWRDDAEAKYKAAPPAMLAAAKLVLAPVYAEMVEWERLTLPGVESMDGSAKVPPPASSSSSSSSSSSRSSSSIDRTASRTPVAAEEAAATPKLLLPVASPQVQPVEQEKPLPAAAKHASKSLLLPTTATKAVSDAKRSAGSLLLPTAAPEATSNTENKKRAAQQPSLLLPTGELLDGDSTEVAEGGDSTEAEEDGTEAEEDGTGKGGRRQHRTEEDGTEAEEDGTEAEEDGDSIEQRRTAIQRRRIALRQRPGPR